MSSERCVNIGCPCPEVEKAKTHTNKGTTNSVILEVAEQLVGGESKLRAAIARGAVRIHKENGIELFSFPSREISAEERLSQNEKSVGETDVDQKQHDDFKVENLSWLRKYMGHDVFRI